MPIAWAASVGTLLAVLIGACADPKTPPERIVLIVADTLRQDAVSAYKGFAKTPNLDALARNGQLFPNALASHNQTTMSMAALFTGRTPSIEAGSKRRAISWHGRNWCGVARFASVVRRPRCIPDALPTLGEVLRARGYWTIGVVSNSLLFEPFGIRPGFDEWIKVGKVPPRGQRKAKLKSLPTRAADKVNAAVARALDARRDDHFFLYVHYMDVHDYQKGDAPTRRSNYARAVERLDQAVGELIGMLEARELIDDSLIVFTSDHGERLDEIHQLPGRGGHRGNPSFEELLRVPLIVSPARFEASRTARSEDVYRMILEAAGATGLQESDLEPGELLVSEKDWQTYRRGKWKTYSSRAGKGFYLYDLNADPAETFNVAKQKKGVVHRHRRRIAQLARQLGTRTTKEALTHQEVARLQSLGYLEEGDVLLRDIPLDLRERKHSSLRTPDGLLARIRVAHEGRDYDSTLLLEAIKKHGHVWRVGFRNGDRIRSVGPYRAHTSTEAELLLYAVNAKVPVMVGVERDGELLYITVPPNWRRASR